MRPVEQRPASGWTAVGIYLVIALASVFFLVVLLRKTQATNLTIGAGLVMLLYIAIGAFLILATRLFVTHKGNE